MKGQFKKANNLKDPFRPYNSFSLEGEDMILRKIFQNKKEGLYVDVGANLPYRYSNTAYFYQNGWRGINIDASERSIELLKRIRSGDINICALVGSVNTPINYYVFDDEAYNTSSDSLVKHYADNYKMKPLKKVKIKTAKLKNILNENLGHKQRIDFMSIDVEGKELDVLKSNNWDIYRPEVLIIEDLNITNLEKALNSEITKYLKEQKYVPFAKTITNIFYSNSDATSEQ
jgi:FkbM family methyltransferase